MPQSYSENSRSLNLNNLRFILVPFDCRVTENIEELAPQFQVSRGICKGFASDLTNYLRSWRERHTAQVKTHTAPLSNTLKGFSHTVCVHYIEKAPWLRDEAYLYHCNRALISY